MMDFFAKGKFEYVHSVWFYGWCNAARISSTVDFVSLWPSCTFRFVSSVPQAHSHIHIQFMIHFSKIRYSAIATIISHLQLSLHWMHIIYIVLLGLWFCCCAFGWACCCCCTWKREELTFFYFTLFPPFNKCFCSTACIVFQLNVFELLVHIVCNWNERWMRMGPESANRTEKKSSFISWPEGIRFFTCRLVFFVDVLLSARLE